MFGGQSLADSAQPYLQDASVSAKNVWFAAGLQEKSEGRSTDLRKCIRPLVGEQSLLALMSCAWVLFQPEWNPPRPQLRNP
jgi:hypothetical protein